MEGWDDQEREARLPIWKGIIWLGQGRMVTGVKYDFVCFFYSIMGKTERKKEQEKNRHISCRRIYVFTLGTGSIVGLNNRSLPLY